MEKLIDLLNEYEKKRIEKINSEWKLMVKLSFRPYTEESLTNKAYRSCWLEICSKYYGFIKHLIDNDKIDLLRLDNRIALLDFNKVERVLMALSIQDKPIEFLISVLK